MRWNQLYKYKWQRWQRKSHTAKLISLWLTSSLDHFPNSLICGSSAITTGESSNASTIVDFTTVIQSSTIISTNQVNKRIIYHQSSIPFMLHICNILTACNNVVSVKDVNETYDVETETSESRDRDVGVTLHRQNETEILDWWYRDETEKRRSQQRLEMFRQDTQTVTPTSTV